ncbi:signal peptide peptidase SppA [Frateuria aurantia]|uniref:Signal peptide peptidase SppA, 67K type n=1 Tax=Frateuria aurantia (strain ATCC 33424 / DSM 6220 / KCTC 2777 / LMG 1558 / NBRC 3245 / NCIMB 13370) TaxID=767434 RepID=H8KZ19_FRAAD|nr:signal peptide peptidase SppA [Frateuria aurantia]AFC87049.1 signal peptide peptidase SppA, 67K type [Frateuria aurantia DSM 6220]
MMQPRERGFVPFVRWLGRGLNATRLVIINLVFFGLLAVLLLALLVGVAAHHQAGVIQSGTVLVLKPEGELVEQYSLDPLQRAFSGLQGQPSGQIQVRDLIAAIDHAATDARITRLLLLPDDLSAAGFANLQEVGAALDRFRAHGKPVLAWAASYDQRQYLLAAHADRILLDPQGSVMLTGLSNYRLFYKGLLDKLGIDVHLFRVGQYKSAAEPFVLDHASDAAKAADSDWMGDLWNSYLDQVAGLRKIAPDQLRKSTEQAPELISAAGGDTATLAVKSRLVDQLVTEDQLIHQLRVQGVPAGRQGKGFRQIRLERYASLTRTPVNPADQRPGVAVIIAEGDIVGGEQSAGKIGGESTAALIRRAREAKTTKALVLRVNSPGGEVFAAEQIRREIALTRKAGIPVAVSMGDVAASGGYWISMNAQRIFADPTTITGSIGIFGMYYSAPTAIGKLGLRSDGVSTGPLAGAFDVTRPLDPRVGNMVQSVINRGYFDFVSRVAQARHQSYQQIDAIAQGRVWSGREALQHGLVDALGDQTQAIAWARQQAHLPATAPLRYIAARGGLVQRLAGSLSDDAMVLSLQGSGWQLPGWLLQLSRLSHAAPELGLLQQARAGRPNVYAWCMCQPD